MTLDRFRRDVLGISLAEAATRAGVTQAHARRIEQAPNAVTLGEVLDYVHAIGGGIRVELSSGSAKHQLDV